MLTHVASEMAPRGRSAALPAALRLAAVLALQEAGATGAAGAEARPDRPQPLLFSRKGLGPRVLF